MAPQQIPAISIIEILGAYRSKKCILSPASAFSMLVSRGIRMAAAFSDPGSRQQVAARPASKQQVASKLAPKQQAAARTTSKQQGASKLAPKKEVASKPVPKQQVLIAPAPKNQDVAKPALRPEVSSNIDSNAPPAAPLTVSQQIDQYAGDPNFMTSLARGLAVIQAFTQRQRELTVSQISTKTGFSRAAVRRCLYTLSKLGFAATEDSRHFHLRPRVLALGHSYISSMPLAAMAQPILENVSRVLHESCSIATLDRTDIVYIARANVTRIMSIDLVVGSRLAAFCTSMGRVLMADLPPNKLDEFLSRVEFKRYTERTVANAEKLRQILRLVQRNGYSVVDQELESGLRSMAVPIHDSAGRVIAALNVGTHAQRVSIQDLQVRFLPQLKAAAQELSLFVK
jgi:IclR family pca regulon transcriptional regulator